MPMDQRPDPPSAPKLLCPVRGVTCTSKTEDMWANGLVYATVRHCDGPDAELRYQRREHALMLTLSGSSDLTRVKISGSPIYEGREQAGSVTYVAADTERMGWYRNANLDFFFLLIDPGFIRSCEFDIGTRDIPCFTNRHDPLIQSVLGSLARGMRDETARLPSVYAEHAAGLLMAHLIHSVRPGRSQRLPRAGLSDANLRRVIEFIEENLGQDISLSALAALTGTGVDVFARNFKACTGLPPYRYVLERRMHRAQALLAASGKSIAEIAFEVGFSSQAHFTSQFSKDMHMSPAAFRLLHRR
jgi:AraC family transcriptional regulator